MPVSLNLRALKETKWSESAVRFACGGALTVVAGALAKHYGPVVGGLFLAFPAIFPSSATLVEKHEREKKRKAGIDDRSRGRKAAALDAAGAAMGSFGLLTFAVIVWKLLPAANAQAVLVGASLAWLGVATLVWRARKNRLRA
jgi:hypothetical protein